MTTSSIDNIVRSVLLRKGYSIHWYLDALLAARDCFRELNFDDLAIINTKILQLNPAGTNDTSFRATLPDDFVDAVECSVMVGQFLRPLVPVKNMNPIIHRDTSGNPDVWDNTEMADNTIFNSLAAGYFWRTVTWNQYGENVGRLFGFNDSYTDTYEIFKKDNAIQVNYQVGVDRVVLKYISDGMDIDAASHVDTYAIKTIEEYIMWQFKEMNRNYNEGEKERARQLYINERLKLRARVADWSIARVKRIAQQASYSAGKA